MRPSTSNFITPEECANIGRFYETRMKRDISFIPKHMLTNASGQAFLDVGAGAGVLTKQIAPYFDQVDVIEPGRDHAKSLEQFNVCHDTFQEATIRPGHYDLILGCHIFYYVPRHQWNKVRQYFLTVYQLVENFQI